MPRTQEARYVLKNRKARQEFLHKLQMLQDQIVAFVAHAVLVTHARKALTWWASNQHIQFTLFQSQFMPELRRLDLPYAPAGHGDPEISLIRCSCVLIDLDCAVYQEVCQLESQTGSTRSGKKVKHPIPSVHP